MGYEPLSDTNHFPILDGDMEKHSISTKRLVPTKHSDVKEVIWTIHILVQLLWISSAIVYMYCLMTGTYKSNNSWMFEILLITCIFYLGYYLILRGGKINKHFFKSSLTKQELENWYLFVVEENLSVEIFKSLNEYDIAYYNLNIKNDTKRNN